MFDFDSEIQNFDSVKDWLLQVEYPKCTDCTIAGSYHRDQVDSRGSIDSPIVFVGEAPGAEECTQHKPFVGKAGILLERALKTFGISSYDYYVTNTIKCNPLNNRTPVANECKICRDKFLRHEIGAYPRKLIVAIGNIGYYGVVPKGTPSGIMSRTGVFEWNAEFNCHILPCIHPAAVLRDPSKRSLLDDAVNKLAAFIERGFSLEEKHPVDYKDIRSITDLDKFIKEVYEKKVVVADIECLAGETLLLNEVTGDVKTIEEIVENRIPWKVVGYKDNRMVLADVTVFVDKGEKECFKIKTRFGWDLVASGNHLVLTQSGWKAVSELTCSDFLARPRQLPSITKETSLDEEDYVFLGYYVSEGCSSCDGAVVSVIEADLIVDLEKAVSKFGYTVSLGKSNMTSILAPKGTTGRNHENRFKRMLKDVGLWGIKSINRFIPSEVYNAHDKEVAIFLSRLFAGDGCVSLKRDTCISYSTSSPRLALQVCHLLLRFGIIPRVQAVVYTYDNHKFPGHVVYIEGKNDLETFYNKIGIVGRKGELLRQAVEKMGKKTEAVNTRTGIPSVICLPRLKKLAKESNISLLTIFGDRYSNKYNTQISKDIVDRAADLMNDAVLKELVNQEVYWAKILSIEPVGVKKVYDLTVPETSNFISGMYVVHNTTGFNYFKDKILCMSFSTAPYTAWYLPIIEDGIGFWDRYDWSEIQEKLRCIFEDPTIRKIGQNIKFDLKFLITKYGWNIVGPFDDTMLMHHLLDENTRHGLKELANRYTDMGNYSVELDEAFSKIKRSRIDISEKNFSKIPAAILSKYACMDVDATFRLYNIFIDDLKQQGLDKPIYRFVVMDVMPVLMSMELLGVRVDRDRIADLKVELENQLKSLSSQINRYAIENAEKRKGELRKEIDDIKTNVLNVPDTSDFVEGLEEKARRTEALKKELDDIGTGEINIKSPDQLGDLLYGILRLPVLKKTESGAPSTDEGTLTLLKEKTEHPILAPLLEFRRQSKLYTTYVTGLDELVADDGRLHTSYLQHGTVTGRLASSEPNLQNIPRESVIRNLFVATEGWYFIAADFKQSELRQWAFYSQDTEFIKALTTSNVHNAIGSILLNKPGDEITKEEKNKVKGAVFGMAYGRGASSIAAEFDMTIEEAQGFIDKFFEMMPRAAQWLLEQEALAKKDKQVKSFFGRIRRLPGVDSSDMGVRASALRMSRNSPIQSASSDVTNLALVRIYNTFKKRNMRSRLLMQVHDSISIESPPDEVKEAVAILDECMTAKPHYKFNVPLTVDIDVSDRWGGEKVDLDKLGSDYCG